MPVFLAALGGVFLNITASIVGRVLASLGMGIIAYKGIVTSLLFLKDLMISNAAGLPPEILGMLSVMKVGSSISIIISAMLARFMITGMSSDTVKQWVIK